MQSWSGFLFSDTGTGRVESYEGTGQITTGSPEHPITYFATGAFSGGDGLPPDGSTLGSLSDWENFRDALAAKTDEISNQPIEQLLNNVTVEYVVYGGTGGDIVAADNTTTANGSMFGRGGDDSLTGGAGHDNLVGGDGDDTLVSTGNGDTLIGGAGHDTIDFTAFTTARTGKVGALESAGDTIDLSGAANSFGLSDFTAVSHFDHHAGEVVATFDAAHNRTVFKFDTDGDHKADYRIVVTGGDDTDFAHFTGVDTSHLMNDAARDHGALVA